MRPSSATLGKVIQFSKGEFFMSEKSEETFEYLTPLDQKNETHLEVLALFLVSSVGTGPLLLTVRDRLLTGLCKGT